MPNRKYKGRADVLPFDDATDLQHRIARSFALVTDWMGALLGHYALDEVLATLARQTQAANVALYRVEMPRGRAQLIMSHDRLADRTAPPAVTGHLARFALSQTDGAPGNGHIWRLSALRLQDGFAGGEADREWRARRDNLEVSLILMEQTEQHCDLLELSFESAPPRSPEIPTSIVTKALSDVWQLRSPGVITRIMSRNNRRQSAPHLEGAALLSAENPYALTPSEMRVCAQLVNGLTAKAIADRLGLSIATVRTHLRNIYSKTGTEGQVALISLARTGQGEDE